MYLEVFNIVSSTCTSENCSGSFSFDRILNYSKTKRLLYPLGCFNDSEKKNHYGLSSIFMINRMEVLI